MYIRTIPADRYDTFRRNIKALVQRRPLDVTYYFDVKINDTLYRLQVLMADRRELVPLQAVKLDNNIRRCELITDPPLLGALTELVVARYGG